MQRYTYTFLKRLMCHMAKSDNFLVIRKGPILEFSFCPLCKNDGRRHEKEVRNE